MPLFPAGGRVLEVGAGTGEQARRLSEMGFEVAAIDLPGSTYAEQLVYPVQLYDGSRFPFSDVDFDVVYTSNLLEHVRDLETMHREIKRVIKPGASVIHVLPTHVWRAWTTATAIPALTKPRRHGERGSFLSETWLYHPRWWRRHFASQGFTVTQEMPLGYFYTGHGLLDGRVSASWRRRLARVLGSATHAFVLRVSQGNR